MLLPASLTSQRSPSDPPVGARRDQGFQVTVLLYTHPLHIKAWKQVFLEWYSHDQNLSLNAKFFQSLFSARRCLSTADLFVFFFSLLKLKIRSTDG